MPPVGDTQWEGMSQMQSPPSRSKGFQPFIGHPSPGDLHQDDELLNWVREAAGLRTRKPEGAGKPGLHS